jgi:hypothetical protein
MAWPSGHFSLVSSCAVAGLALVTGEGECGAVSQFLRGQRVGGVEVQRAIAIETDVSDAGQL